MSLALVLALGAKSLALQCLGLGLGRRVLGLGLEGCGLDSKSEQIRKKSVTSCLMCRAVSQILLQRHRLVDNLLRIC